MIEKCKRALYLENLEGCVSIRLPNPAIMEYIAKYYRWLLLYCVLSSFISLSDIFLTSSIGRLLWSSK